MFIVIHFMSNSRTLANLALKYPFVNNTIFLCNLESNLRIHLVLEQSLGFDDGFCILYLITFLEIKVKYIYNCEIYVNIQR